MLRTAASAGKITLPPPCLAAPQDYNLHPCPAVQPLPTAYGTTTLSNRLRPLIPAWAANSEAANTAPENRGRRQGIPSPVSSCCFLPFVHSFDTFHFLNPSSPSISPRRSPAFRPSRPDSGVQPGLPLHRPRRSRLHGSLEKTIPYDTGNADGPYRGRLKIEGTVAMDTFFHLTDLAWPKRKRFFNASKSSSRIQASLRSSSLP